MAWTGVVTNAGRDLFGSGVALEVDSVRTGSGTIADGNMRSATALATEKDKGLGYTTGSQTIVESQNVLNNSVQIKMRIGSAPSSIGAYTMKELGLYMNSAGSSPVMVAYFKNPDGVAIPSAESFRDFSYVLAAVLAVDTSPTISLTVPAAALVSEATFEEEVERIDDDIAARLNKDQGTENAGKFLTVGSDGIVIPADITFEGATSGAAGKSGLVPAPAAGRQNYFLRGDGTWALTPDTVYTAGTGLSLAGNQFSLANSGVTAGNYGPSADVTGNNGSTVVIPYITVDAKGRITSVANKTVTFVNTTYTAGTGLSLANGAFSLANSGATAGNYGPSANVTGNNGTTMSVPYITVDAKGRITSIANKTITFVNTTYTAGTGLSLSGGAFSLATSGATAGSYGMSANTTGNEGTTVSIPYITVDAYGRITSISNKTLTCKNSTSYLPLSGGTVTGATVFSNTTDSSSTSTGAVKISGGLGVAKNIYGNKVWNAVWNDYAECREAEVVRGGLCVREDEDGIMKRTKKRLQSGCKLTSDTFGQCMGKTDKALTPIAVAGRVLAYPYRKAKFKIGKAVCSAPGGMVDVMNRLECILFPDRIIGYVSEIPTYAVWNAGTKEDPNPIRVDGRVWIYVR